MINTAEEITAGVRNATATNMVAAAGYTSNRGTAIPQNTWITVTMTVDEFVGAFSASNRYEIFKSYITVGASETFDFYFSGIEFVNN